MADAAIAAASLASAAKFRPKLPQPARPKHGQGPDARCRPARAASRQQHWHSVTTVQALSDDVKTFYERLGFEPSPADPRLQMITLGDLQDGLE